MSTPRTTDKVINGHFTRTRNRLDKGRGKGTGRVFVEVLVWQGKEATGEPLAEWEMPHVYRYDHDAAARQAVAQTRFPSAGEKTPDWVYPPTADEAEQWPRETFVITREKRDGSFERLSGRDFSGKLDALEAAIGDPVLARQAIWLKIHRDNAGTPVTGGSPTMSMLFTVEKITDVERVAVVRVIEEKVPEEEGS